VVAFHQGVTDEKMLEKFSTHDIQDITELFSLVNKCARVAEGHAWHTTPAPEVGKDSKTNAGATAQAATTRTTTKKSAVTTNHWSVPPLPQLLLLRLVEAEAHEVTSAPIKCLPMMTVEHNARYTTPRATARVSARTSRSS
jgi:hypothetical protein